MPRGGCRGVGVETVKGLRRDRDRESCVNDDRMDREKAAEQGKSGRGKRILHEKKSKFKRTSWKLVSYKE